MIYLIGIPNIKLYNAIRQNYIKRTGKAQYVKMTEAFRKTFSVPCIYVIIALMK